jgi:hypothetical protein
MIAEYIEGFQRCYPGKQVELKPKKTREGDIRFRVLINREPGDILLSEGDVKSATRLFNRGRTK